MYYRHLIKIAVASAISIGGLQFVSCSQPTNGGSEPKAGISQPVTGTPTNHKNGGGKIQTITETVVNHTSESMTMRLWTSTTYTDISVPIGESSTDYSTATAVTGIVVNGQSVPSGTPTNVILPNNAVVRVSWTGGTTNIVITLMPTGG